MNLTSRAYGTTAVAAVAALAGSMLGTATLAQSPPPSPATVPVSVQSCNVLRWQRPLRPDYGYYWRPFDYYQPLGAGAPVTDGLAIRYTNHGPAVADRVEFQVDYRGDVQDIVDVGTFSPGVSIDHQFANFSGLAFLGNRPNHCRVIAVRYTGGATWRRQGRMPATTH